MKEQINETFDGPEFFKAGNNALYSGLFFILLGGIFYMSQLDLRPFGMSPWVLFMLIPVYWALVAAWKQYEMNGRQLTGKVLISLFWGLFPFLFIGGFTFGLSASLIWPMMFIVIGLSMIFVRN
ncbi:MAG: hypothetical protein AAF490_20730 [Chloroflexota bacterium]